MSNKGSHRDADFVLRELRSTVGNSNLCHKNIVAWSSGTVTAMETGELIVYLPLLKLNVCYTA